MWPPSLDRLLHGLIVTLGIELDGGYVSALAHSYHAARFSEVLCFGIGQWHAYWRRAAQSSFLGNTAFGTHEGLHSVVGANLVRDTWDRKMERFLLLAGTLSAVQGPIFGDDACLQFGGGTLGQ